MPLLAGLGLIAAGVALFVWRAPVTRRVVDVITVGYGRLEPDDPMLKPLAILTSIAGAVSILLGLLILAKILLGA